MGMIDNLREQKNYQGSSKSYLLGFCFRFFLWSGSWIFGRVSLFTNNVDFVIYNFSSK